MYLISFILLHSCQFQSQFGVAIVSLIGSCFICFVSNTLRMSYMFQSKYRCHSYSLALQSPARYTAYELIVNWLRSIHLSTIDVIVSFASRIIYTTYCTSRIVRNALY